ncbi:hypothetical protein BGZ94_009821 [Podila epigama]|nr:hypothetical protein BGZ94_009821 [Podila epigama]
MSDFFGFNTAMPGRPGGRPAMNLEEQQELDRQVQKYALETGEDFEIYDYGETYDNLADDLEETRDDLNDETFGGPIQQDEGTDFDFAKNTRQIAPALKKEEELYIQQNDVAPRRSSFASLWENDASAQQDNFKMGLPEPSHAASSIWGSFSNTTAKGMDIGGGGFVHDPVFGVGTFLRPSGFGNGHQHQQSLEEVEAQLLRAARGQPQRVNMQQQPLQGQDRKMMSLEEVEAALMNINGGRPIYSEAMLAEQQAKLALLEKRRAAREAKQAEIAKYNGLMTQGDKDFINRIQISQLVTDDPYADDFYCQVYTAIRNRHLQQMGIPGMMEPESGDGNRRRAGNLRTEQRMQQQVQRIVSDAKRNPKRTNVTVEGALGKIAVNSVLNPRQLLQVSKRGSHTDTSGGSSPKAPSPGPVSTKSHTVLSWIENVYTYVLALEQKRRQQPPPPRMGEEEIAGEAIRRWNEEYGILAQKMWSELRITYPIGIVHPHPFISILNYSKGKKVIPRVLRHLLPEQTLTLLTMLVANFESLDVCKTEVYADVQGNQEIELFMNTIVPPLLGFVSEAPFRIVVGLLALFIERNNMVWVARSKPGLAFLTLFLSRAEILKQGQGNYPIPDDREILQWNELYNRLFDQLKTHFSALFMPKATIAEDVHVWRFLAAMAVGATVEQQHVLVTEVREQVLENVIAAQTTRMAPEKAAQKIGNVNLFLHALGLDASQVTVPAM